MSLTKVQSAMIGGDTGSTAFAPGTPSRVSLGNVAKVLFTGCEL